jgi:hypothetical protein
MDNMSKCLEIVLVLDIMVIQGHSTSLVKETDVGDGATEGNNTLQC